MQTTGYAQTVETLSIPITLNAVWLDILRKQGDNLYMSKIKNPDGSPAAYKVKPLKVKTAEQKAREEMLKKSSKNKGPNKKAGKK